MTVARAMILVNGMPEGGCVEGIMAVLVTGRLPTPDSAAGLAGDEA